MDYSYKTTTHGRAVMAACMDLEKPLHITRVTFGSGKVDEETNLADVHELLEYVSEGAIAERSHEDDRLYLTIQFANSQHPEVKTFFLSEFIVYVEDPETEEETDLIYGSLGDYRQPVPSYNPAFPPSVFNFPLTLILSDEIQPVVSAPAGLITYDDLQQLINEGVIGISRQEATISASDWDDKGLEESSSFEGYPYHADIPITGAKSRMTPIVAIYPECLSNAGGICQIAETIDGAVRLFAKTAPSVELKASIALIGGSSYLPIATRQTPGSVIIGDGLTIDIDGKVSVDKEVVLTNEDLVDEDEVAQSVANILNGDGA